MEQRSTILFHILPDALLPALDDIGRRKHQLRYVCREGWRAVDSERILHCPHDKREIRLIRKVVWVDCGGHEWVRARKVHRAARERVQERAKQRRVPLSGLGGWRVGQGLPPRVLEQSARLCETANTGGKGKEGLLCLRLVLVIEKLLLYLILLLETRLQGRDYIRKDLCVLGMRVRLPGLDILGGA